MISLFFVCVIRGQIARWFVRRAKTILLLMILAQLKSSAKDGQAKIAGGNFFGALFAPIFSRPLLWAEKAVNFLNREGQKRGATHGPRQSVLPLYVAKQCQRCKNVTLW